MTDSLICFTGEDKRWMGTTRNIRVQRSNLKKGPTKSFLELSLLESFFSSDLATGARVWAFKDPSQCLAWI